MIFPIAEGQFRKKFVLAFPELLIKITAGDALWFPVLVDDRHRAHHMKYFSCGYAFTWPEVLQPERSGFLFIWGPNAIQFIINQPLTDSWGVPLKNAVSETPSRKTLLISSTPQNTPEYTEKSLLKAPAPKVPKRRPTLEPWEGSLNSLGIPGTFGPTEWDQKEFQRDIRRAMTQHCLSEDEVRTIELKYGPLRPYHIGRGNYVLAFDKPTWGNLKPLIDAGFSRREDIFTGYSRKLDECSTKIWHYPNSKDFYAYDSITIEAVLPDGEQPLFSLKNKHGVGSRARIRPSLEKIEGLPKGILSRVYSPRSVQNFGKIGKEMLKNGISSQNTLLSVMMTRLKSSVVDGGSAFVEPFLSGSVVTRIEIKSDVEFPESAQKYFDLIEACPFLAPRMKDLVSRKSLKNGGKSVTGNFSGRRRNAQGGAYLPRNGFCLYQVKDFRKPGRIALRLEFRVSSEKKIKKLLNKYCPLTQGDRKRVYHDDILVPGVATHLYNGMLEDLMGWMLVEEKKAEGIRWNAKGNKEFKLIFPMDSSTNEWNRYSKEYEKVMAKVKAEAASKPTKKKGSKFKSNMKRRHLRHYMAHLKNLGEDLPGFLKQFLLDPEGDFRNGYFGMRKAEAVSRENAHLFPKYLERQNVRLYHPRLNVDFSDGNDSTSSPYPNKMSQNNEKTGNTLNSPRKSNNRTWQSKKAYNLKKPENQATYRINPQGTKGTTGHRPHPANRKGPPGPGGGPSGNLGRVSSPASTA